MSDEGPFYWTPIPRELGENYAPSGWYQWTRRGLMFLGESILESVPPTPADISKHDWDELVDTLDSGKGQ